MSWLTNGVVDDAQLPPEQVALADGVEPVVRFTGGSSLGHGLTRCWRVVD